MMKKIITSHVVGFIAVSAAIFAIAMWTLSVGRFITILNGLFVGTSVAVGLAYWRLFVDAMFGDKTGPYKRVRQMTWGFFILWLAVFFGASGSIYTKIMDMPTQTTVVLALSRYFAITAAVVQVTAPDYGQDIFHGRDRKVLAGSAALGLAVAIILIYLQGTSAEGATLF